MSDPTYPVNRALADIDYGDAEYSYPLFSLAERDRRWSALREVMNRQEIDVIVTPQNSGHSTDFQANSRWISQCGGGGDADIAVVFPLQGEVTAVATSAQARWPTVQNWVTDVREARRNYGRVIVERLQELHPRRIGIAGLGGGTRTPEGTILYGTMRQISDAFPDASVVDATDILSELRYVKSEEEIAFLARSRDIIELGTEAEVAHAKPGVSDWLVWAEAMSAMLRAGSEMTVHFNWVSGPLTPRTLTRPSHRILQRGDLILNELEASWGGYRAQSDVPVGVGQPDPVYLELMKVQKELWYDMLDRLKPGTTIGELQQRCASYCAEIAPRTGPAAGATALLNMHGRGAGDDGPIITGSAKDPKQLALPLRERMVFILKPGVHTANDSHNTTWGDTVVVTAQGGQRLGKREHGIAIAGD
ncbi:MAG TPA: M24 family metallopeptidase [Chloroflexota bacterium]